jgi:hypothetical protein
MFDVQCSEQLIERNDREKACGLKLNACKIEKDYAQGT